MGQPTTSVFERVGHVQLPYYGILATPSIKYDFIHVNAMRIAAATLQRALLFGYISEYSG